MCSTDSSRFIFSSFRLISSGIWLVLNTESVFSENFLLQHHLSWILVRSWGLTVVFLQLTGFSCLVSMTLHSWQATAMSQQATVTAVTLFSTQVYRILLQLFAAFLIIYFLGDDSSFQITCKYMKEHRAPHRSLENPTTTLFLAGKLPIYCHPFFPIYNNLLHTGQPLQLTETKPSFQVKGKIYN